MFVRRRAIVDKDVDLNTMRTELDTLRERYVFESMPALYYVWTHPLRLRWYRCGQLESELQARGQSLASALESNTKLAESIERKEFELATIVARLDPYGET